jgi:hypothetical protein
MLDVKGAGGGSMQRRLLDPRDCKGRDQASLWGPWEAGDSSLRSLLWQKAYIRSLKRAKRPPGREHKRLIESRQFLDVRIATQ